MPRWGMFIDLSKCAGCQACTIACKYENNSPFGVFRNEVLAINVTHEKNPGADGSSYPTVRQELIPRPCMHCDNAPCTKVCPVKATYQREDGIVMQDMSKCVGCKYCMNACPYGARYFQKKTEPYEETGMAEYHNPDAPQPEFQTVNKCTFCHHRIDQGNYVPACVQICPAKARYFGNLDDPDSQVNRLIRERRAITLRPEQKTKPKTYYAKES